VAKLTTSIRHLGFTACSRRLPARNLQMNDRISCFALQRGSLPERRYEILPL
jgi:hypothetical protein